MSDVFVSVGYNGFIDVTHDINLEMGEFLLVLLLLL